MKQGLVMIFVDLFWRSIGEHKGVSHPESEVWKESSEITLMHTRVCEPLGEMNKTPMPPPSSLSEPSKYITQCSGMLWGAGIWFSRHSAKKSTSACDLIAVLGLKLISKAPSSTAHFEIRPVASRLWRISPNGKSVITEILYSSK